MVLVDFEAGSGSLPLDFVCCHLTLQGALFISPLLLTSVHLTLLNNQGVLVV